MNGEFSAERPDDDAIADARRWGLPDDAIASVRAELGMDEGERLWAMHLDAFRALCAAGTQWRRRLVITEQGFREVVAGLDYAALGVALGMLQLSLSPVQWGQLMLLEREAVRAMNGEPA